MSVTTTLTPVEYIAEVADRFASREVDTLHDVWAVGSLVHSNEISYDAARDGLAAAFAERGLSASTAKVYVSQGYGLAQLFATFDEVEAFADDECKGSRSLKRIYDATRVREPKAEAEGAGEAEVATTEPTPLVDVILANLAHLTDPAEIARVRDAAAAMLTLSVAV